MSEIRKLSRRSFLSAVAGGAAVGALAITVGATRAEAQVTDSDPSDPVGRGRGRRSGITDRDPSDPVGGGRGRRRGRSGITDRDPSDPVGNGRGRRRARCTDSDSGRYADRAGYGRRCR